MRRRRAEGTVEGLSVGSAGSVCGCERVHLCVCVCVCVCAHVTC